MPEKREVAPELVAEWERILTRGRGGTLRTMSLATGYSRSFIQRAVARLRQERAAARPQPEPVGRNPTIAMPATLAQLIAEEAGRPCR